MNGYKNPLPNSVRGTVSKRYWNELKEEKFIYQTCDDCNSPIFYARVVCPNCLSDKLSWEEASGKGEIYSFTIVYRTAAQGFKEDVPYAVGLIDLDEGIRVTGNIIGWDNPGEVQIEQEVSIEYHHVSDEVTLPVFRVVKEDNRYES